MKSPARYYAWQSDILWSYSREGFEHLLECGARGESFRLDDSVWGGRRVGNKHVWWMDGIFLVPAKYAFRSIVMPCAYFPEQFEVILQEVRKVGEVRTWAPLGHVILQRDHDRTG